MAKARNAERRGKFDERTTAEPRGGGGGDVSNDVVPLIDDAALPASAIVITSSIGFFDDRLLRFLSSFSLTHFLSPRISK